MRIISGKYKNRQLYAAKDQSIRPTTDKVKEYIFGLLGDFVQDANVLDLFCGSGSLGLEALSRGAKSVVFVDNAQRSLRVLRRNINRLKVEESYTVVKKDVKLFLKQNRQPFDLIFADPPFPWDQFEHLLPFVFTKTNLTEYGLFVLESERSHKLSWDNIQADMLRKKQFDRSLISFSSKKGAI